MNAGEGRPVPPLGDEGAINHGVHLWACPTCGALCPKENEAGHLGWHEWLTWKLNEGPRRTP